MALVFGILAIVYAFAVSSGGQSCLETYAAAETHMRIAGKVELAGMGTVLEPNHVPSTGVRGHHLQQLHVCRGVRHEPQYSILCVCVRTLLNSNKFIL